MSGFFLCLVLIFIGAHYHRRKSFYSDSLAHNQDNVSSVGRHVYPWTIVSVSWHYKNPTQHVGLVQSGPQHLI
jgi:hypothetical protein